MAISINWSTRVISVPKAYLTPLGGNIYELDLDTFRLDLKDLEDSEEGMPFPDTHNHNTTVTLGGVTLARVIEFINGYTVTFEDGQYAVNAVNANSNIADVMNVNQVSLRTFNSAGLQVVISGSGVTPQDKLDIADAVWDEALAGHTTTGSASKIVVETQTAVELVKQIETGRWRITNNQMVFYDTSGAVILIFDLLDSDGTPTMKQVYERVPV